MRSIPSCASDRDLSPRWQSAAVSAAAHRRGLNVGSMRTPEPDPAENDLAGRAYIKQLMGQAGLAIREDKMGNIYGTLPGADPAAAAVGTGSHCDAIPLAGAYDGTTGGASLAFLILPCRHQFRSCPGFAARSGVRAVTLTRCWFLAFSLMRPMPPWT